MAKASTAVATKAANLPAAINAAMAAEIAAIAERVSQPTGSRISVTQSKTFKLPDGRESPGPLDLVVVDFVYANYLYEGTYDRNNITPPVCFAINLSDKQMVPSDNSPKKQAGACAGCAKNQFGSAGKGKACSNTVLLAVLHPDDLDGAMLILKVSATATKAWNGYVNALASSLKRAPWSISTQVSFDPHSDYPSLRFSNPQVLDDEALAAVFPRREEAARILAVEPDVTPVTTATKLPAKRAQRG